MLRRVLIALTVAAIGGMVIVAVVAPDIDGGTRALALLAAAAFGGGFATVIVYERDVLRVAWSRAARDDQASSALAMRLDEVAALREDVSAGLTTLVSEVSDLDQTVRSLRVELAAASDRIQRTTTSQIRSDEHRDAVIFPALTARLDTIEGTTNRTLMSATAIQREQGNAYRQLEAHVGLVEALGMSIPLPPMRGTWALPPDAAALLVRLVREHARRSILELGSGLSTVVLARALQLAGGGSILSIEHDERFARDTQQHLDANGLSEIATIVPAPLEEVQVGDRAYRWYGTGFVESLPPIDMLIVDGPPAESGRHTRYPAVPLLAHALEEDALIYLDDTGRADEEGVAEAWKDEFALQVLPIPGLEKGGAVFRWSSPRP